MDHAFDALTETRRRILIEIKHQGGATISAIASHLRISDEGARQHLIQLERRGWVSRRPQRESAGHSGRPASVYEVSPAGESFFPKRYDELSVLLIDTVGQLFGMEALKAVLARITEGNVSAWKSRLAGKPLEERLELLKHFYVTGDPFTTVEKNGRVLLVERNCPFWNVAMARPALCSTTVSTLTRLLGYRVVRREKFQNGDGRCVFEVLTDHPVDPDRFGFAFEAEGDPGDD